MRSKLCHEFESLGGMPVVILSRVSTSSGKLRTAFLEVFERDQRLILRPPKSHVIVGVIFFLAFELVGWGLIYVNFNYRSSDWQPNWEATGPMRPWSEHSFGDQFATIAFLTFFCGAFIAGGFFALSMGLRHFRPWTFWRDESGALRLSRGRKSWVLAATGAVRLRPTKILTSRGVAMEVEASPLDGQAPPSRLRIHRVVENKGISLADVQEQMRPLAQRVGSFIGWPVVEQSLDGKEGQI